MNKAATQRFIEITYERYKEVLGQEFGGAIPAIFTDEPGYVRTGVMDYATDKKDIFIPWTEALEEIYAQQYGESLIAHLPELFWELPEGELSLARYQYHELVTELFTSNHLDTLGNWCDKNGIILTGLCCRRKLWNPKRDISVKPFVAIVRSDIFRESTFCVVAMNITQRNRHSPRSTSMAVRRCCLSFTVFPAGIMISVVLNYRVTGRRRWVLPFVCLI